MPVPDLVQSFVETSNRAGSFPELRSLIESAAKDMGFDYYALIQHVDVRRSSSREIIWLENYPDSWAEAFVSRGLYANDPILVASQRTNNGFQWSKVSRLIRLNAHHKRVLANAAREGMGDGFTVPAHVPGDSNGTCNFAVRVGRDLPEQNLMMAQLVGMFAFESARRIARREMGDDAAIPKLTPRQLECLLYVARGKSDWEIAQILGLKEYTVRDHIQDACERYDVHRRVQLVLRAIHDGQILLSDSIG